MVLKYSTQS